VLHVAQPVDGGVARVVTDLVHAQVRAGLRVAVACPPGGHLAADLAAAGAAVHPWDASREPGPGLAPETARLARTVRRTAPGLVHAHSAKAGLAARLALRGRLPTVFQPHAWSFEAVAGPRAAAALRWERHAARWTTRVLCVSEAERRRGEDAGVRARWAVVPNGVDTARFTPAGPAERLRARAELAPLAALPATAPLVVCVGRLCRQKGQDVLLRAWPEVSTRVPAARLVLVGDGPDRAGLRAAAPPGVVLAGHTDDPVPWYAAADLVVLPSRWEGMALAPLEAMARRRPVVLTDVTGARESLPPGQAADCLVPAGDAPALAAALVGLLSDPARRESFGRRAARHVTDRHDVRRTAAAVAALYHALTAVPPSLPDEELVPR
jgi:glycosyltransferase involved in cell wall biosynthesis